MFRLPKPHPEERRLRRVSKDGHKRDSGHTFAFPRRLYARAMHDSSASQRERAQGMPGARCARSLVCEIKKHTSVVTTGKAGSPGVSCAMVLRVPSCSSRRSGFLAAVTPEKRWLLESLISASRYQNHTTSPSATGSVRLPCCRVHRIPRSTFVTTAKRPSVRSARRPNYWT
jgi:hypothetical protein